MVHLAVMLHAIGRKRRPSPDTRDLVDTLLECHARIRTFASLAVSVSEGEVAVASSLEVIDACMRVERYFTEALPLHVRDEEESVLPRLRGRSSAVDAALDRMHEQHELHEDLVARLLVASAALRSSPRDVALRAALLGVARPLRAVLEPHLAAEEDVIFPALRALVPLDDQRAVEREIRARR